MKKDFETVAEPKFHLPFIDGLRGIAVLLVLMVHTSQWAGNVSDSLFLFQKVAHFVNAGARGVQLFFIISAFTLFSSSRARFASEDSPKLSFYLRRSFRIMPAWWLTVLVYALWKGSPAASWIPVAFMYFGFIRYRDDVQVVPHGWSIFVEESFYVFMPFVFKFVDRLSRALIFLAATYLLHRGWIHFSSRLGLPQENAYVFMFPLYNWIFFGIGIAIFYIFRHPMTSTLIRSPRLAYAMDALAAIALYRTLTDDHIVRVGLGFACLFVACFWERSLFGRLTRHPLLRRFGVYCYTIYLMHPLVLEAVDPFRKWAFHFLHLENAPIEARIAVWMAFMATLMFAIGYTGFTWVEKPCITFGKRVIRACESAFAEPRISVSQPS